MEFKLDMHTHTVASGHAYSTIQEMVISAKEKGLLALGITEHAPKMPGSCKEIYFMNLKIIPRQYKGLHLYLGSEVNILDEKGTIDLQGETIKGLDYLIASLHTPCIAPGTIEQNTNAYLNVMKKEKVRIIGHPDDQRYPIDYKELVGGAKENHVLLEVNNSSLSPKSFRANARENYKEMLCYCEKYEVPVIVGSDAHIGFDVGNFMYAKPLLEELHFPEKLIVNTSLELLKKYLFL